MGCWAQWPSRVAFRPSRSDVPLTAPSTAAGLLDRDPRFLGYNVSKGGDAERELATVSAEIANHTCLCSIREDRNHDAVMRIGDEIMRCVMPLAVRFRRDRKE